MGAALAVQYPGQHLVLGGEFLDASGEALERGEDGDVHGVAGRPRPGQCIGVVCAAELCVLGADGVRRGDEDLPDLVEGGGAGLGGGPGGVVQSTDAGDAVVLGRAGGPAGQSGSCGRVGVDRIGLADAPTLGPVRPVDLYDGKPFVRAARVNPAP
ncbi:hypothetical protein [Streptomyces sp. NPDC048419]|uniref:hypothetical protein n=1 Tax=Streptomyces sp. NPDC048419 TaxID=3365547 RepID=UPI00371D1242